MKFSEGTAPAYEPTFTYYSSAFYGCFEAQSSRQVYNDQGRVINIDAIFYCDASTSIDENDKYKKIDLYQLTTGDIGTYYKELIDSNWTLTSTGSVGTYVIFYGASSNTGTGAKCNGKEYSIYRKFDPIMMNHHLEIFLYRAGSV